jgi:hypothetical protein
MEKPTQESPHRGPVDVSRRRLTKIGLAAPAVMGTLASKRVLGATYYCTTSGQVSGNVSTHGPDNGCDIAGALSPDEWKVDGTSWSPVNKAALFNGYTYPGSSVSFPALFWVKNYGVGSACAGDRLVSSGGNGNRASLIQVLTLAPSTCDEAPTNDLLILAREAIAALVNAATIGTSFPITPSDVIAMFNAVYLGGNYVDPYWLNKNAKWNASDVVCYFRLLHGEVSGCSGLTT